MNAYDAVKLIREARWRRPVRVHRRFSNLARKTGHKEVEVRRVTPRRRTIAFRFIAETALAHSEFILQRWLPDGERCAGEWVARNPRRSDRHLGSFKVNLRNGRWGDFATGDAGGDLISLAAFLFVLKQDDAARRIAEMLGVSPYE